VINGELRKKLSETLSPFVPEKSVPMLVHWIDEYKIKVVITPPRKSKFGDYRSPDFSRGHQITVNGTLNQFEFLITFVHEVAHLVTWLNHKGRVPAHGIEWKNFFKELMQPFFEREIFPHEIHSALSEYMVNPLSSQCYDAGLKRALKKHDKRPGIFVEELASGETFIADDGNKYVRGKKRRTTYECLRLDTKRIYLFNAIAEVKKAQ